MSDKSLQKPIFKFLKTDAGVKLANVNGAVTPVVFKIAKAGTGKLFITEMHIQYGDTSNWSADEFGDITPVLPNGISVAIHKISDDSVEVDLTDGLPIKSNAEWGRFAFENAIAAYGSGADFQRVRWDFVKNGIPLHIEEDEYFAVTINDDLTGLTDLTFMMHGFEINE